MTNKLAAVYRGSLDDGCPYAQIGAAEPMEDADGRLFCSLYDPMHSDYAAVGDGTTNDRAAVAAADTAAAAAGEALRIANGTFLIGSDLTLAADVVVELGGRLKLDAGVTLTMSGKLVAGFYQIFELGAGAKVYGVRQAEPVKAHWWGITDNSEGAAATNTTALTEALSSFVDCTVVLGGMKAYIGEVRFASAAAPWATRHIHIDGQGAQLISTTAPASLTGPVFQCLGGTEVTCENLTVGTSTAPDCESDSYIGSMHLVSVGGYDTCWPDRLTVRRVYTYNGWCHGLVAYHADHAMVDDCEVYNCLGTGIYVNNVRKMASVRGGYVHTTGDDNVAFTTDTEVAAGCVAANIDDILCEDALGGSGVTFTGTLHCSVGSGFVCINSYAGAIRTEPGGQASPIQADTIIINNPQLIRAGRADKGGVGNDTAGASGVALTGVDGAVIRMSATIIDAKYAGLHAPETCSELILQDVVVEGNSGGLGVGENPTIHGLYLGHETVAATVIDRALISRCSIRNTNQTSLYLTKLKSVEVVDCLLADWNQGAGGQVSVGVLNCDWAKVDQRSNRFGSSGTLIDTTGTTTYVGESLSGAPSGEGPRLRSGTHAYVVGGAIAYSLYSCGLLYVTAGETGNGTVLLPDKADTFYIINNASGYTITPQISGGSGVALANGATGLYLHNGTDYVRLT